MLNFNDVEPDNNTGEFQLIPNNTIARAVLTLQGGDTQIPEFGQGNFFKSSSTGKRSKWLPLEFTIVGGTHNSRKVWHRLFVDGDKMSERNVPIAKEIGLKTMRLIIESSRGIKPDDNSPEAQQGRQLNTIEQLNGMELCIKIGIEEGTNGYEDRNRMIAPLTPNQSGYIGSNSGQSTHDFGNGSEFNPPVTQNQNQSVNPSGAKSPVPNWAK